MTKSIQPDLDQNPYLLLTPGPLSTSRTVRRAMLRDWCTWDDDYNRGVVEVIRRKLVNLATSTADAQQSYTAVLMQGSGTFAVESVIGSIIPADGKLLVLSNGAYGQRIGQIANALKIDHTIQKDSETEALQLDLLEQHLMKDSDLTHVAVVHGETTTGMLNPIEKIGQMVKAHGKTFIVDAMSTFGGVPIDIQKLSIDYIISSANKCIQGVPGFGFIVAKRDQLQTTQGWARSLSLDLYDQWSTMESNHGKWRFTSPTHTVRAFAQALTELESEGGVVARHARYTQNQKTLVEGMTRIGFRTVLALEHQSPIITAFHSPQSPNFNFLDFYTELKEQGFVIYPGKVTNIESFRIGTIGEVYPDDIERLLKAIEKTNPL
ncbi:MAG: 2-aminoethylphosphonate--pyruvate transaminase [Pirellulaceae bacterium]|nr:2-aminoethylphosphonate--pyruvate transaminase [Pirellulaceae bacterium]